VLVVKVDRLGAEYSAAGLERDVMQEVERLVLTFETEDEVRDARDHRSEQMLGCPAGPRGITAMNDGYPRKVQRLEVNEADDGLVVYDPATEMVHHLNPSASLIFDLCDGSRDVDGIAELLAEAYGLDAPPRSEVLVGLEELARLSLVTWEAHNSPDS
jgi:hypothetical protein